MNLTFGQLGGMIRYEALMQFRRRTIIVFAVFFVIGTIGLTAMMQSAQPNQEVLSVRFDLSNAGSDDASDDTVTIVYRVPQTGEIVTQTMLVDSDEGLWIPRWYGDVDFPQVMTTWRTFAVLSAAMIILLIAVPPMLAEVIPLDRQYKIREVMDALPLSRAVYLFGKLAATWLGVAVGLTVCAVVFGVYSRAQFGVFDLWTYARFWLLIVLPFALIITGYAVVAPAFAGSRRVGVLVGIFLIPLAAGMAFSIISGTFITSLFSPLNSVTTQSASYEEIVSGMFSGVLEKSVPYALGLAAVAIVMWAWMRFREAK